MQPSEYVTQSLKTEARDFTPVMERMKDPARAALTLQLLSNIMELSKTLDGVKKDIFYNKELEEIREAKAAALLEASKSEVLDILQITQNTIVSDEKNIRLLHSIVGLGSEIGELIECFLSAMADGQPMDVVNFKEEMGDTQWYTSIGLDAAGTSYEEIWTMNRDKLAKRYTGQKFTEEQAVNRNLTEERKTLEGNAQ